MKSDSPFIVFCLLMAFANLAFANYGPPVGGSGATGLQNGDVKHNFATALTGCWVPLQGQLKSSLTAPQQVAATALGIGANLPDARDRLILGASGGQPTLATGGASAVMIGQTQLPNVNLGSQSINTVYGGNVNTDTSTSGNTGIPSWENATGHLGGWPYNGGGNMFHVFLNGNVTQQPLNIRDPSLAATAFVCLM